MGRWNIKRTHKRRECRGVIRRRLLSIRAGLGGGEEMRCMRIEGGCVDCWGCRGWGLEDMVKLGHWKEYQICWFIVGKDFFWECLICSEALCDQETRVRMG